MSIFGAVDSNNAKAVDEGSIWRRLYCCDLRFLKPLSFPISNHPRSTHTAALSPVRYGRAHHATYRQYEILYRPLRNGRTRAEWSCCPRTYRAYWWCFDISKISKYRFDIVISYRIARGNIEIFDIPVSTFWYTLIVEFSRVASVSYTHLTLPTIYSV